MDDQAWVKNTVSRSTFFAVRMSSFCLCWSTSLSLFVLSSTSVFAEVSLSICPIFYVCPKSFSLSICPIFYVYLCWSISLSICPIFSVCLCLIPSLSLYLFYLLRLSLIKFISLSICPILYVCPCWNLSLSLFVLSSQSVLA